MPILSAGSLVAKHLKEVEKLDTVFGLASGSIAPLLHGLVEHGLDFIDARHEQAATMMAHAWSVYTGQPGVALLGAGPGFTNGLTGIANAFLDHAPLVVLCGMHPLKHELKGALQELDQLEVARPITKWAARCHDPRRLPEYLSIAFREATSGRPGPAFLELPPEVLQASVEVDPSSVPLEPPRRYAARPEDGELAKAAAVVDGAHRPLLLGGSGLGWSRGGEALGRFVEKTGMPFMLLDTGRGELPDSHPLSVWDIGTVGLIPAISQADVLVLAGLRLDWMLLFGSVIPPGTRVVRIDVEASELDRNRRADLGLLGDVRAVLEALTPLVERRAHREWRERLLTASRAFLGAELEARSTPADPIHPLRLVELIQRTVGEDAVYVVDGADTGYYGQVGFRSRQRAGVLRTSGGLLGCLGAGLPFGMAAKLARPDTPVIVLTGDGSFGFNAMEFDTLMRHGLAVVCVINNDGDGGRGLAGGLQPVEPEGLVARRYEKMVEGLGGHAEWVTSEEALVPALERALASGKPACVNVVTDPTVSSPATQGFYQSFELG